MLDDVLQKNGGPEAVFKAAIAGTAEGATRLRAVMQSLDADGQKALTATVMRRLGRAKPGQQDDVAEKFSTETFLTNFSNLSREAKRSLFDRYGPGFRQDMDAIAKVASNLRDGSKVYSNPSGTTQGISAQTVGYTFVGALLTGNAGVAAGIAAAVGGSNLAGRLLTNPNLVRFLADSTKVPAPARDLVRAIPQLRPVAAAPTSTTRRIAEALAQQSEPPPGPGRDLASALYEAQRRGGR